MSGIFISYVREDGATGRKFEEIIRGHGRNRCQVSYPSTVKQINFQKKVENLTAMGYI
jgi:hypothetical protein